MPYQTRTIFGTGPVQYDDADRARQAASMQGNDAAVRMAIAQLASGDNRYGVDAQVGMQRYGIDAQKGMFGDEMRDRGAARDWQSGLTREHDASETSRAFGLVDRQGANSLALAKEGNAPAMGQLDFAKQQYGDQAGLRALQQQIARYGFDREQRANRLPDYLDDQIMGSLGAGAPGASGGGVVAPAPGPAPQPGPMPAPRAGAGAVGAAGGAAMPGRPGLVSDDMMRSILAKRMGIEDPTNALDQQRLALAAQLAQSDKPEARALGAQLLSQSRLFKGVAGADPATLAAGLGKKQDAATALQANPALQHGLDLVTDALRRAGGSFSPDSALESAKPQIDAIVKQMTDFGVPQDQALAAVQMHLESSLPSFSFGRHPISKIVDMLPGVDLYGSSSEGRVRNSLGLRR